MSLSHCNRIFRVASLLLLLVPFGCQLQSGVPATTVTGSTQTSNLSAMAVSGAEKWTIDGHDYKIESTYYLALPEGLQYTVNYLCDCPELTPFNDSSALRIASPILRHAVSAGLYNRASVSKLGEGAIEVQRVGVAIIYDSVGITHRGYRIAQSIADIQEAIDSTSVPSEQ